MGEDEEVDNSTGTAVAEAPEQDTTSEQSVESDGAIGEAEQPSKWDATPLPPELSQKYEGAKTWGDLDQKYQSSSQEVRRYQSQVAERDNMVRGYQALFAEMRKTPAVAAPIAAPNGRTNGYYGYPDKEAFNTAFQTKYAADPIGALSEVHSLRLKHDSEYSKQFRNDFIDPALRETVAPFEQKALFDSVKGMANEFWSRNPGLKEGPVQQAMTNVATKHGWFTPDENGGNVFNHEVTQMLGKAFPGMNPFDVLHAVAEAPLLRAQLQAASKGLEQKRNAAATARPGTGGRSMPKDESTREGILAAAEHARTLGEEIPQHIIDSTIRAMEKGDWNRPKKNRR